MEIKELLVEGFTKKIYTTAQSDEVVIELLNVMPRWVSAKKKTVKGKALANNAITSFLFEYLDSFNVPTHYIRKLDDTSFLATRLEMIPVVVTVWNVADSEFAGRYGFEDGGQLENPIVEMFLKNYDLNLPMINEYHAYALGLCDRNEMNNISRIATKVNAVLKSFFERRKLKLVNFSMEFGRAHGQIFLGDELSPDCMRLWSINDDGSLDRKKLDITGSNPQKIYQEIAERILGKQKI